jgi:hypothetical protein
MGVAEEWWTNEERGIGSLWGNQILQEDPLRQGLDCKV